MRSNFLEKPERAYSDSILFNCCYLWRAPDWSQYRHLEIIACRSEDDGHGGTITRVFVPYETAKFWTVYGRKTCGEAEAITDCYSLVKAASVAIDLSRISGLPIILTQVIAARSSIGSVPATIGEERRLSGPVADVRAVNNRPDRLAPKSERMARHGDRSLALITAKPADATAAAVRRGQAADVSLFFGSKDADTGEENTRVGAKATPGDDYEPAVNLAALLMLADYSRYVFWVCAVGIVLCLQWYALKIALTNL